MSNKVINFNKQNRTSLFRFYRPVLIILLIGGYDFDLIKRNVIYTSIARFYSYCLVIVVIYSSVFCCPPDLSQVWSLFEYSASVILTSFFQSRIESFFNGLMDIDSYLRINIRYHINVRYKLIFFALITWSVRMVYTITYCYIYICFDNPILFSIRQFSLIALDLNRVWRCILFDIVRYRLRILRMRLEEAPEYNYYLYVKNNKSVKENKMTFCLYLYRSIADLVDLVSPELHASLFLSIVGSLPKLISNVFHILTSIEGREPLISLSYVTMHVVQISLLLFSPFVAVEFYSVEVDRMKLFLTHRLIDGVDPEVRENIEMFLRYTDIRNFKYKIWRIIPINLSLPLEMINICINYVIVLINFSHLYG